MEMEKWKGELINKLMKISALLSEAILFPDYHEIKVDPDRDGPSDLADDILPAIVKIAYKYLTEDRDKHEQKYGQKSDEEDAYNFEFTEDHLAEIADDIAVELAGRLKTLTRREIKLVIDSVKKDFQVPLDKD